MFGFSDFVTWVFSGILAVLLSSFGIFYAVVGYSIGFLLGNILNIIFLFKEGVFRKDSRFNVKKIFYSFSLPMQAQYIITSSVSIIVPILSLFFPQGIIGYYSFAFMFYSATLLIPRALSSVLLPKVSELDGLKKYGDAKDMLIKAFVLYSLIVIVGIVGVVMLSEWFICFIAKEYLPSLFVFKNLLCFGLVFGYDAIYMSYLQALKRVKRVTLLTLLQNVALFVLSFIILRMPSSF